MQKGLELFGRIAYAQLMKRAKQTLGVRKRRWHTLRKPVYSITIKFALINPRDKTNREKGKKDTVEENLRQRWSNIMSRTRRVLQLTTKKHEIGVSESRSMLYWKHHRVITYVITCS